MGTSLAEPAGGSPAPAEAASIRRPELLPGQSKIRARRPTETAAEETGSYPGTTGRARAHRSPSCGDADARPADHAAPTTDHHPSPRGASVIYPIPLPPSCNFLLSDSRKHARQICVFCYLCFFVHRSLCTAQLVYKTVQQVCLRYIFSLKTFFFKLSLIYYLRNLRTVVFLLESGLTLQTFYLFYATFFSV